MTRPWCFGGGVLVLVVFWIAPWPQLALPAFTAHMVAHMGVVALAAPLLALGFVGGPYDPVRRAPGLFSAILASMIELVLVWAWHMPALHHLARVSAWAAVAEQASFLGSGLLLWCAALGGSATERRDRATSGVAALLLTSMHMTLLGALIALTPRVLYGAHGTSGGLTPLDDQNLGGAVMLLFGGFAYLVGGVGLVADALRVGPLGRAA